MRGFAKVLERRNTRTSTSDLAVPKSRAIQVSDRRKRVSEWCPGKQTEPRDEGRVIWVGWVLLASSEWE